MPAAPDKFAPVLVLSIVGWRVVSRIRRNIGRQLLKPPRLYTRIAIYSVITLFLASVLLIIGARLSVFAGLMGGLVLGALLGLLGLHLTSFETMPEGLFYTPNPYMGVGISFLLVVRLAYRYVALSAPAVPSQTNPQLALSPLTLLLYGLLAGYYIAYFIGVLVKSKAPQNVT